MEPHTTPPTKQTDLNQIIHAIKYLQVMLFVRSHLDLIADDAVIDCAHEVRRKVSPVIDAPVVLQEGISIHLVLHLWDRQPAASSDRQPASTAASLGAMID